jgi:protein-tyrosine phosphatase
MEFQKWFDEKLVIGAFPIINNEFYNSKNYDYVINVSDEYYKNIASDIRDGNHEINTFWFPMNEAKKDVGLNSIYGAMVILLEAETLNKKVYLHCHAGVNRSRCVQAAYYFMRTGKQLEIETNGYINRFVAMCSRGYLPPKIESENFLIELGKQLDSIKMMGGILDHCKLETIK